LRTAPRGRWYRERRQHKPRLVSADPLGYRGDLRLTLAEQAREDFRLLGDLSLQVLAASTDRLRPHLPPADR
jgi:hypothetical protein